MPTNSNDTNNVDVSVHLPRAPEALKLWSRALLVAAVVLTLFLFDRLTFVFLDLWMLQGLGFEDVFWTNFRMGFVLFLVGFAGVAAGIAAPALINPVAPAWRRLVLTVAVLAGLVGGYLMALQYQDFLLLFGGQSFGETDTVFGKDVSFYMFSLPAIWTIWTALTLPAIAGLISAILCTWLARRDGMPDPAGRRLTALVGTLATPLTLVPIGALGFLAAVGVWLSRYDLLWKDNYPSAIYAGAGYVDINGLFSYLNYYYVTALLLLVATGAIVMLLKRTADTMRGAAPVTGGTVRLGTVLAVLVAVDFGFAFVVTLRQATLVSPNEPVIQLPYIKQHIDATLKGFDLHNVETVNFVPLGPTDPLPSVDQLMATSTMKNAPLWPGWVSYLERVLDPQHAERPLMTNGDPMVYGPTLDIFRAQQKLRTYYDFIDVDTVRYNVNGEKRMFVSSVREIPLADPQPWITWWGQRMMLFTHGYGLVMAPVSEVKGEGEPEYVARDIPAHISYPELTPANQGVYYGEGGSIVMAFSNANQMKELDHPTDEGRAEVVFPPSVHAGVSIDSLLKRIVIGWRSGVSFDIWFSDLIGPETRVHYYRPPLDRIKRIAPFLYLDSNSFAVAQKDGIKWLVNGMTTGDRYPYALREWLGDKSNQRTAIPPEEEFVNYVRDSVKAVVDAYSGDVTLYKIADEPVVNTWASIYPGLFTPGSEMPQDIRAQLQYPVQLMHVQFDDVYIYYHMTDPLTFYNMEDMWDDADEVKGPILADGETITFSVEPRHWMAETGEVLPRSSSGDQFVLSMVFTNEQALNLRAIPLVYQDGDEYGRKVVLQVPKGHFFPGPEQADAALDQEPDISEQISWWNRVGAEVIHGHTSTLVIGRDVVYVAPLFIRSRQNPVSQLKRVMVVYRGFAAEGDTLQDALQHAIDNAARQQQATFGIQAAAPQPEEEPSL